MATTRAMSRDRKKPAKGRLASPGKAAKIPDALEDGFVYTNPFGHGEDTTKYRLVSRKHIRTGTFAGTPVLVVEPEALVLLAREAMPRRVVPPAPEASAAGGRDPGRPGSLAQRPVHGDDTPEECRRLVEVRAALLPGHGDRHGRGLEGAAGLDRRRRRGVPLQGDLEDLYRGEPPLLPDLGAGHVRRGQHREQPPGADRYLRDPRAGLPVPLRGQGGRLGEQGLPLPGDEGPVEPGEPGDFPGREDEEPRDGSVSSVPHRDRDRRDLGGSVLEDRQARLDRLLRLASDDRRQDGPRLPRSGARGQAPYGRSEAGVRSAVRRQVLRPRRPGRPAPAPRSLLPGRPRRLLLGRPERPCQNRREGDLARGAGAASREAPPRPQRRERTRRHRPDRLEPADGRGLSRAFEVPRCHPARPDRPPRRRARPRPREAEGAPRRRQRPAAVLQGSPGLLRGTGQDAQGEALRVLRSDDGGTHGLLRGPLPVAARLPDHDREGEPEPEGNRGLQEAWRLLPRIARRPGRAPRGGEHQEGGRPRVSGAGHGGDLDDRRRGLSRLHPRGRQGERFLPATEVVPVCGSRPLRRARIYGPRRSR